MKQFLVTTSLLLSPSFALAAFNDVSLTTDAVIQVGSYTLNVTGSTAVIQSIEVGEDDFIATLATGSSMTITSPTRNQLQTDTATGVTNTCNSTVSSLAITGATTVTITPSATICQDTTPAPEITHSRNRSGSTRRVVVAPTSIPAVMPATNPQSAVSFSRSLTVGSTGNDVRVLQKYLNAKGYTLALTGPGSLGNETETFGALTRAALVRFQKEHGIVPAVGFFGPITRAFILKN